MIEQTLSANVNLGELIKKTKTKNKDLKLALDGRMKEFKELQTMRIVLLGESKKLQEDVDTVNLDIQDAFRTIEKTMVNNKKNLTNNTLRQANEKKLRRYLNEEPEIRSKNDFLKERLDKQVKELPKASRSQFEFEVRKFKAQNAARLSHL